MPSCANQQNWNCSRTIFSAFYSSLLIRPSWFDPDSPVVTKGEVVWIFIFQNIIPFLCGLNFRKSFFAIAFWPRTTWKTCLNLRRFLPTVGKELVSFMQVYHSVSSTHFLIKFFLPVLVKTVNKVTCKIFETVFSWTVFKRVIEHISAQSFRSVSVTQRTNTTLSLICVSVLRPWFGLRFCRSLF